MGFMNVLEFSAACFDLLGWPLIALGYPLCASIWAIETNSISGIRKLVTYWVLFSLISLFDHAFSKHLEWIPFWPCIKLMVICWLMIPHFNGSYYVYQHLVHPCLSMDPQVDMNWQITESKTLFHSGENFLVLADQYIKENGAEALENLLASKVKQTEINRSGTRSSITCAAEIEERATALVAAEIGACRDNRTPEIPLHKKVQKEWACAVCQVTTQSEATLNSHLQGKRHKATSEQLKAKNQATNGMKELGSWCNICDVSCTSEHDMTSHLNGRRHFNRIKQLSQLWCSNCNVKCNSEADMASHRNGRRHLKQLKERRGLWCSICSVNCNSEVDMDSHLNGRRHLDQIKEQLRLWCGACNVTCNSEINMASHLNGRRHAEKRNF